MARALFQGAVADTSHLGGLGLGLGLGLGFMCAVCPRPCSSQCLSVTDGERSWEDTLQTVGGHQVVGRQQTVGLTAVRH